MDRVISLCGPVGLPSFYIVYYREYRSSPSSRISRITETNNNLNSTKTCPNL